MRAAALGMMLLCGIAQGAEPKSVTKTIGMELIEITIGESIESQQMLSKFLEEPWTKYETAIATAEKSVVSTLTEEFVKQFEAAAALGDFDLVESIEAQKKAFEKNGTLPTGKSFEPTLQAIKKTGEDANTQLKTVYSNAISDLTKQKRLAEARIVNNEMQFVFRDAKLLRPIRKKGYFRMGEGAGVAVTLTKSFALGKTEVTQGQWQSVMSTEPWKGKPLEQADKDCPATYMSWDDAKTFCQKLTDLERKAEKLKADEEYRLPTEAEWECACRAGTQTAFSFGEDNVFAKPRAQNDGSGQESKLGEYGWFNDNTAGEQYAHVVGLKKANPWGLHDMHGNVWEWCLVGLERGADSSIRPNKETIADLHSRVVRGGSWREPPGACGSTNLRRYNPSSRYLDLGFRVARSQSAQ